MRLLLVQNHPVVDAGLVAEALDRREIEYDAAKSFEQESLPDPFGYTAVVIFGSPESCCAIADHPALLRVRDLVTDCVAADKPVLGLCFGAQVLAYVLGGDVHRHTQLELGRCEVSLTSAGVTSSVFAGFPKRFEMPQCHFDTFDLPNGAQHLATSSVCANQAFAAGPHIGLQFHLEAMPANVARWAAEFTDELPRRGISEEAMRDDLEANLAEQTRLCDLFVANFLQLID